MFKRFRAHDMQHLGCVASWHPELTRRCHEYTTA
eukprot:CAMPEP_0203869550 /NCGR_PEP_ID=MMETSP0359-20131031/17774_1 /ASSEMBLY_ACC=CAM_ASM_000338 /TAXON_ID=268821 /ORGANISM="Scrippsiella Hangoei, Strain SHTV-5" /LENGTH=33 /DNA_ID= /DNA_START= /DNA_END= /DNA_ORIENTATION=